MTNTLKTVLMGALGLCVAAMLGYASLQLVSQPVGLSSEPLTAGNLLVPVVGDTATAKTGKAKTGKAKTGKAKKKATTTPVREPVYQAPTATPPPVYVPPSSHSDDSRGSGSNGRHDD